MKHSVIKQSHGVNRIVDKNKIHVDRFRIYLWSYYN